VPGRYPQATIRLLTVSELQALSMQELRIMRNEIYARHGYIFKKKELMSHFSDQPWYKPCNTNVDHLLTDIEKKNIELIKQFER
jgi:hypothetical protein